MATKNNIRSIRFSDELAELINQQIGRNFQEKFENLITRCVWELPKKEEELKRISELIRKKQDQLTQMNAQASRLGWTINELFPKVKALEDAIDREANKWES